MSHWILCSGFYVTSFTVFIEYILYHSLCCKFSCQSFFSLLNNLVFFIYWKAEPPRSWKFIQITRSSTEYQAGDTNISQSYSRPCIFFSIPFCLIFWKNFSVVKVDCQLTWLYTIVNVYEIMKCETSVHS